jgi:hypothetical protein
MRPDYEWRECVSCEAKYIEECKHQEVGIGGIHKLPDYCYREDLVRDKPKPHPTDNDI